MERSAISVVISTYRRAEQVRPAIASILAQAYPPDRFELIVVDNAGDEATAGVVRDAAAGAPIRVVYVVEERNGCAAARNRGIAEARFAYVAFLDDDATAVPGWLAAFDAVIREHHAMVVGGRTVPVLPEGVAPPAWFAAPYIQTHFGANRPARARSAVRRVAFPESLAVGGGNSVYARSLLTRFGGFPTAHGRTATKLRASEETALNLLLERHDIPLYLADAARIDHMVDRDRLSKPHLRRRSFWRGVSLGEIRIQVFGRRVLPAQLVSATRTLPALLAGWLRAGSADDRFVAECRLRDRVGFLAGLASGALRPNPLAVSAAAWGARDWLAEAQRWPEGIDKQRRLYELYRELGDADAAQAALDRLVANLPPDDDGMEAGAPEIDRAAKPAEQA